MTHGMETFSYTFKNRSLGLISLKMIVIIFSIRPLTTSSLETYYTDAGSTIFFTDVWLSTKLTDSWTISIVVLVPKNHSRRVLLAHVVSWLHPHCQAMRQIPSLCKQNMSATYSYTSSHHHQLLL
jgi:hypothetical protein